MDHPAVPILKLHSIRPYTSPLYRQWAATIRLGLVHRRETAVILVAAVISGYLVTVSASRVLNIMLHHFVVFGVTIMAVFLGRAWS